MHYRLAAPTSTETSPVNEPFARQQRGDEGRGSIEETTGAIRPEGPYTAITPSVTRPFASASPPRGSAILAQHRVKA